jgi:hydrogenase maturation protease
MRSILFPKSSTPAQPPHNWQEPIQHSVCIVAVGSPHGDDQAGWHVVEQLRRLPLPDLRTAIVDDPLQVLDVLGGCTTLILVDACRGNAQPGTIFRLAWPDPRTQEQDSASTHGFGVSRVLALADTLGVLPPSVVLIGVEGDSYAPGVEMSAPVRKAIPELCRQVMAEAREASAHNQHRP